MYTLKIKNYRAIKDASIHIDGITVLAGINGSGKSTLSRWLYYLINATHSFEAFQRKYFIESLVQEVERVQRVFRPASKSSNYQSVKTQIRHLIDDEEPNLDVLKELYFSFLGKADIDLHEYVEQRTSDGRLAAYLLGKETAEDIDAHTVVETYLNHCRDVYEMGFNEYSQKMDSYRREDLERVITSEFSEGERIPADIVLMEGDTLLLDAESFTPPLTLNRAIYIDSPMAVSGRSYYRGKDIWEDFHHYLYNSNPRRGASATEQLHIQIQSIIGGDIRLTEDQFHLEKELHYVSREQGIDINVNDAATGVKSFAYMSQLLNNGWLDSNTLLLIDEPEAHLHPQWVVEFARLLVKIHKALDVKIVLASHNPDMVAALQSIARKEGVIKDTTFYLAERSKHDFSYDFVEKGEEIGDIFTSFNIALSRIELYGASVM